MLAAVRPEVLFERLFALPWYRGVLEGWVADIGVRPGLSVLEVGCGTGCLTRSLLARGIPAVGVDRSARMIRAARRHLDPADARYFESDAADMPFADREFDWVIAASLINVVGDPRPILLEMKRVVAARGRIGLLVPNAEMTPARARAHARRSGLTGFSAAALESWARKTPKGDGDRIAQTLQEIGFTEVRHRRYLDDMVTTIDGRRGSET